MSVSSKKLQDADTLADKYKASFGDKYSSEDSSSMFSSFNLKGMWNLILLSRKRLAILLGVSFVLSMLILIKWKPNFILVKKQNINESDKIDIWQLLKYSFIFGFLMSCLIFGLSYKVPFIKNIIFKEEDCELCQS